MQWAAAWEVGAQKGHLVCQNMATLKEDILCMGRGKRNGQKLHPRTLWRAPRLMIITADTGRNHIVPMIRATLAHRPHMIPGELPMVEMAPTIEAEMVITLEQRRVVEWRSIFFCPHLDQGMAIAIGGNNGVDLHPAAPLRAGIDPAMESVEHTAAPVCDLIEEMQAHSIPVVDPLQGHARYICAQNLLPKIHHKPATICCLYFKSCMVRQLLQTYNFNL